MKTTLLKSKIIAAMAAVPLVLGAGSAATAAGSVASSTAQRQATIDALLALTPQDSELAGKSDADLVVAAVRCATWDAMTYCLHLGWQDTPSSPDRLRGIVADQQNDRGISATGTAESVNGELRLADQIRRWAALPQDARVAAERIELEAASKALAKAKLMHYVRAGVTVPDSFWRTYPEAKGQISGSGAKGDVGIECLDCNAVGDPNRGQKQFKSYYCGPASMVAMAWNDPNRGNELSPYGFATQYFWADANHLRTDIQGGTAISDLVWNINYHLTWRYYVYDYIVQDIGNWSVVNWQNMFRWHFHPDHAGPVQLHPKLNASNNTYGMTTDGHFNVARGYNFDVWEPIWYINIYESAGGSRVPVSYWETHANIIAANRNHPMHNIGY